MTFLSLGKSRINTNYVLSTSYEKVEGRRYNVTINYSSGTSETVDGLKGAELDAFLEELKTAESSVTMISKYVEKEEVISSAPAQSTVAQQSTPAVTATTPTVKATPITSGVPAAFAR